MTIDWIGIVAILVGFTLGYFVGLSIRKRK
jgi:hypothetical protein